MKKQELFKIKTQKDIVSRNDNSFPRRLIEEFMNKNKYALLSSFVNKKSKDYYRTGCDNDLYKDVIHWNYIFKNKLIFKNTDEKQRGWQT